MRLLAGISAWWVAKFLAMAGLLAVVAVQLWNGETGFVTLGRALVLAGAACNLWHYAVLKRGAGELGDPRALVMHGGLFRWIRHPMYVGDLVLAGGLAALAPSALAGGLYAVLAIAIVKTALCEDAMMRARFGEDFDHWAEGTGLLLPRRRG